MTTFYSWRLVFAGETVVVLALMLFLRLIPKTTGRQSKLDLVGAFLSAAGLGLAVFGILRSSQWGWIAPSPAAPFTLLGLSPVFWLIVAGLVLLGLFARYERRMIAAAKEPLLDIRLLEIPPMRAGLITYLCQQFIIMGTFFVLPLYLQTVLGYNAMETGIILLPLSMALLVFALGGARLAGRYSPKRIAVAGLVGMLSGEVLLIAFTGPDLRTIGFGLALALVGAGNGLLVSQLGNVIMSSVSSERGSEAGGLQGTAMNLGASLGVALVGSILIASLVGNFQQAVLADPALAAVAPELTAQAEQNANFASVEQVTVAAEQAGLTDEEVAAVTAQYADAQIMALKVAFASIALFSLLALWYVNSLPKRADGESLPKQRRLETLALRCPGFLTYDLEGTSASPYPIGIKLRTAATRQGEDGRKRSTRRRGVSAESAERRRMKSTDGKYLPLTLPPCHLPILLCALRAPPHLRVDRFPQSSPAAWPPSGRFFVTYGQPTGDGHPSVQKRRI
ncbi:MAG: MFS transporter [Anaerolineales bacterium]|nr:MFS transporter [Anaerolineales bacterium]